MEGCPGELRGQHPLQGPQEEGLSNYRAAVKGDMSNSHSVTSRRGLTSSWGLQFPEKEKEKKRGGKLPSALSKHPTIFKTSKHPCPTLWGRSGQRPHSLQAGRPCGSAGNRGWQGQGHLRAPTSLLLHGANPVSWQWGRFSWERAGGRAVDPQRSQHHTLPPGISKSPSSLGAHRVSVTHPVPRCSLLPALGM